MVKNKKNWTLAMGAVGIVIGSFLGQLIASLQRVNSLLLLF